MNQSEWYVQTAGNDSVNHAAQKSGLHQKTLSRYVDAGEFSAEAIVAVARAYGKDVIQALEIQGLLTDDDVRRHGALGALADATDREIVDEIWRRLQQGQHEAFDEPLTGPSGLPFQPYDQGFDEADARERMAAHRKPYDTSLDVGEESQVPPEDWDE